MVKLIINGTVSEFEESAAQRILQVQAGCEKNGGTLPDKYELTKESLYEFVNNGLRYKPTKGTSKKADKLKADSEGENPQ